MKAERVKKERRMKVIEKLRKATEEVMETIHWPAKLRMIKRAAEAAQDKKEAKIDEVEQQLTNLRKSLTKIKTDQEAEQILNKMAEIALDLDAAKANAEAHQKQYDYLMSEAETEVDGKEAV